MASEAGAARGADLNSTGSPIRIYLLGRFEVVCGERVLSARGWDRRRAAALLQRLALERRLVKDQAIDFLWPDADPVAGANNLYRTLYALRRTLDTALGPGRAEQMLRFEGGVLSLAPSVWVDVHEFERLSAVPAGALPEQRAALFERALALYEGGLLPDDPYAEWTLLPRDALYRRQRDVRLALAAHRRDGGDYAGAIALLRPLLAEGGDPADEPVHRELMRLYALAGQRHEALRQYQACVDALAAELDVAPEPETIALHSQILGGDLSPPPAPYQPPWLPPSPALPEVEEGTAPAGPSPAPLPPDERPLFVGRDRELAVLDSHLRALLAGSGGVVLITGEAGQGKTSLMAHFAARAQAEHPELVVAVGACQSITGTGDPYLPFRDLLAMLHGDWQRPWLGGRIAPAHARRLQAIAPHTARAVATFAPDLADVILPVTLRPSRPVSSQQLNRHQVLEQMRQLLQVLAEQRPLLLLLDDLQWADSASASLLFYLGRQLTNTAVLIVGAYRPSETSPASGEEHPLAPVVQELVRYRGDILIDLDHLAPAEGRHFVDAFLDSEPNRLDASFREAMFQRTRGHPLFTVELLRALQEQGDLGPDEVGRWLAAPDLDWDVLPARVEAVIARRLDRLPPHLREMLALASVEGETFSAEVVAEVQGQALYPLLRRLSGELDRRYRLVREQGEIVLGGRAISRYQFRHNLFQHYLYHQLGSAERRYLHGRIAAALEQIAGGDLEGLAVPLAHHYLAAGNVERAVPHLCRAGNEARRRVALEEAVQFYRSALAHWPPVEGEDDAAARAGVLHRLGESLLAMGRSQEAIDSLSAAEGLYARAGSLAGVGATQRLIGRSYWEQGARAAALEHYHRALAALEQEPEGAELARAISAISQMHVLADELDEALAWGERALALARRLDAQDVLVHALASVGLSIVNRGQAEQGLAMLVESQERAEALGLPHDACRAHTGLGDSLLGLERYAEARSRYERLLAYAEKVHAEMFVGVAMVHLCYLDWWTGRWAAAWERRQTIQEWLAAGGASSVAGIWASRLLANVYNDLGLPARAREVLAPHTAAARGAGEPQTTVPHLAQLARAATSEEERSALMREMLDLLDRTPYARYEVLPALRLAGDWLARTSGGSPAAYDRLEKAHEQAGGRQAAASLHEVRAVAAGVRGEWALAAAGYREAARHWTALERPYDLLRAWAGLAGALAHTGDGEALAAVRRSAAPWIERLAAGLPDSDAQRAFLALPWLADLALPP